MYIYDFNHPSTGEVFIRVSKNIARRAYNDYLELVITASKMRPFSMWGACYETVKADPGVDFETLVNNFEWYNCTHETGYYASYYIRLDDYNLMIESKED